MEFADTVDARVAWGDITERSEIAEDKSCSFSIAEACEDFIWRELISISKWS